MARSRPSNPKEKPRRAKSKLHRVQASPSKRHEHTPTELLAEATTFLHTGDPESALPLALRALVLSKSNSSANGNSQAVTHTPSLSAINLLAEINIELGDPDAARNYFLQAVALDPDLKIPEAEGGGAEKFLWLAQLCEEGGEESVRWFERGAEVLRRDIASAEEEGMTGDVEDKKRKLVGALCGIVEVYMTDLSYVSFPHSDAYSSRFHLTHIPHISRSPQCQKTRAKSLFPVPDLILSPKPIASHKSTRPSPFSPTRLHPIRRMPQF